MKIFEHLSLSKCFDNMKHQSKKFLLVPGPLLAKLQGKQSKGKLQIFFHYQQELNIQTSTIRNSFLRTFVISLSEVSEDTPIYHRFWFYIILAIILLLLLLLLLFLFIRRKPKRTYKGMSIVEHPGYPQIYLRDLPLNKVQYRNI